MQTYEPIQILPMEIQQKWQAQLYPAYPTGKGQFRLVSIRPTAPKSFEEQRITVLVVDENGFPMPNIAIAFSYSTADPYFLPNGYTWNPPTPHRAFIVPTQGSGQIDQIQGSVVKQGEPGGVTVYAMHPDYPSDYISGAGMLADHTGLHLTFQLRRNGIKPITERLRALEDFAGDSGELARQLSMANAQIANLTAQVSELVEQSKAHF